MTVIVGPRGFHSVNHCVPPTPSCLPNPLLVSHSEDVGVVCGQSVCVCGGGGGGGIFAFSVCLHSCALVSQNSVVV